ncbi:N-acetylmuramoyl-L-alanine amidase [bacterium]|jgi:N-acetylmuramoyl-L-alanine amidase|nr:N-acetylmuramoyl-L-alanine amidase [Verrucomicrobiales bacterium]MDC3255123.1 N-acetylmuramoyl-L-alanine amidase [bacterium]
MVSRCTYPLYLTACMLFLSIVGSVSAKTFKWQEVKISGRRYIPANSISEFYRFHKKSIEGNVIRFIYYDARGKTKLTMTARVGSQTLMMNTIKFILSYPVTKHKGHFVFSRLDLCKLIDPVLRPKSIVKGPVFDTVVIDPGHGGHDSGAACALGKESNFALNTANHLKRELQKRGYKVVMTRTSDRFITLGNRVKFANRYKNAIFISLHYNSGQSAASGIETFALSPQGSSSTYTGRRSSDYLNFEGNGNDGENIALSTAIHAGAIKSLPGTKDRGIKRARWNVLTGLKIPGTLYEGGFLSNSREARKIASESYRKQIAKALAEGIENYKEALIKKRRR